MLIVDAMSIVFGVANRLNPLLIMIYQSPKLPLPIQNVVACVAVAGIVAPVKMYIEPEM